LKGGFTAEDAEGRGGRRGLWVRDEALLMIPDLASVMRKRYRMERNLRLGAVVLFVVWMMYVVFGVVSLIVELRGGYLGKRSFGVALESAPFLFGAVLLGVLSGRIARWILPIPKSGCPRCGYRLVALAEPRCPECGLELPRELMGR
jgi:hypothetical protein